jgi:hypothetical protein
MIYDKKQKAYLRIEKHAVNTWGEYGRRSEKMDTAPVDRSGQGDAGGKCLGRLQNNAADWSQWRESKMQKKSELQWCYLQRQYCSVLSRILSPVPTL